MLLKTKKGAPSEVLVQTAAKKEKRCENGAPVGDAFKGIGKMILIVVGVFILASIYSVFNGNNDDDFQVESFKDSFLYSCKKNASTEYCNCLLTEVENNYTPEEMREESKYITENKVTSDKLKELIYKCNSNLLTN